jgi:hypothetical protein
MRDESLINGTFVTGDEIIFFHITVICLNCSRPLYLNIQNKRYVIGRSIDILKQEPTCFAETENTVGEDEILEVQAAR